jgi:hypothetical protein
VLVIVFERMNRKARQEREEKQGFPCALGRLGGETPNTSYINIQEGDYQLAIGLGTKYRPQPDTQKERDHREVCFIFKDPC